MELAPYVDRNSSHEVLYKAVSRDGAVYRGVLVRPNILVSLNDNDPDVVASTEHEALERLLWTKLNSEDETPGGFVEVKWDDADNSLRGFFYEEYDELDETMTGVTKFHGLLPSGSDVTLHSSELWVRPWLDEEEGSPTDKGPVYQAEYSNRWSPAERNVGFLAWDSECEMFRELKAEGHYLASSVYDVHSLERVPQVGDVVHKEEGSKLLEEGYRLKGVGRGVELVREVPTEVQEALRWL